ncbi:MAG: hypothetical protein IKX13_00455 [Bacteroidales bacterium]|jgi:hypothetical protein|nr:hypothetical protein [Bacteroidales bacterium]MBR5664212.1 hypothetical protein [Bacteroidales bacterium]
MRKSADKKEKYLSPQMELQRFALEKGFAISEDEAAATQLYDEEDLSNGWDNGGDESWF